MMKSFLSILFFLTSCFVAFAQSPRMTVRESDGSQKPLRIEQADVSVRMLGEVAETAFELTFRNDGPRAVEGEFALTLPEGRRPAQDALDAFEGGAVPPYSTTADAIAITRLALLAQRAADSGSAMHWTRTTRTAIEEENR